MTGTNVVENNSTPKGTAKIDVSHQVKAELVYIKDANGHTSMDSVIRTLLERNKEQSALEWLKSTFIACDPKEQA